MTETLGGRLPVACAWLWGQLETVRTPGAIWGQQAGPGLKVLCAQRQGGGVPWGWCAAVLLTHRCPRCLRIALTSPSSQSSQTAPWLGAPGRAGLPLCQENFRPPQAATELSHQQPCGCSGLLEQHLLQHLNDWPQCRHRPGQSEALSSSPPASLPDRVWAQPWPPSQGPLAQGQARLACAWGGAPRTGMFPLSVPSVSLVRGEGRARGEGGLAMPCADLWG